MPKFELMSDTLSRKTAGLPLRKYSVSLRKKKVGSFAAYLLAIP